MASEQPALAGPPPPPQVVGIAFVHQYYNILYQSPGLVYRFYQEISKLGRPDAQGSMSSITTMEVKVMKENVAPSSVSITAVVKAVPSKQERQPDPAPMPSSVPEISAVSSNVPDTSIDGHSIYIKGLPLHATVAQLEEEFKRFGSIKPGGIQVRSQKQHGFCFGFIEFETAASVQSAIEASPVMIDGGQVSVEEKRPAGSRVGSRGRFSGRMGGFQSEGGRGRGYFGGGRVYGRGDFSVKTDFGGRGGGRGVSGRGDGGGYQRVDHMVPPGGRISRPGSAATGSDRESAPA